LPELTIAKQSKLKTCGAGSLGETKSEIVTKQFRRSLAMLALMAIHNAATTTRLRGV
jgi:hypothetical protein